MALLTLLTHGLHHRSSVGGKSSVEGRLAGARQTRNVTSTKLAVRKTARLQCISFILEDEDRFENTQVW